MHRAGSMPSEYKDTIYVKSQENVEDFRFDAPVVRVFQDMIERSIPGYRLLLELIGLAANRQIGNDSIVYDLGCSLGGATLAMRRSIMAKGCKIIGVDNSVAMLERCKKIIDADNSRISVELIQEDINNIELKSCHFVVMNFTLQFLSPSQRLIILKKINDSLRKGGSLLVAEKISFEDEKDNETVIDWHHNFKRSQGYSDLEISQKRKALEKVMLIDTEKFHLDRFKSAGFNKVIPFFQGLNFRAWLVIKN